MSKAGEVTDGRASDMDAPEQTPGPWYWIDPSIDREMDDPDIPEHKKIIVSAGVNGGKGSMHHIWAGIPCESADYRTPVLYVDKSGRISVEVADARLIAASPELLDACKKTEIILDRIRKAFPDATNIIDEAYDVLDSAIGKAQPWTEK